MCAPWHSIHRSQRKRLAELPLRTSQSATARDGDRQVREPCWKRHGRGGGPVVHHARDERRLFRELAPHTDSVEWLDGSAYLTELGAALSEVPDLVSERAC